MIGAGSASAAGQDFVHGSCTFRLSVFSDWGKAAGSNRDQNGNCGNLTVTLYYGVGGFPTWSTSKGPTNTDYLKVNAGYYDPNRTTGKAGSSSTQTIYY